MKKSLKYLFINYLCQTNFIPSSFNPAATKSSKIELTDAERELLQLMGKLNPEKAGTQNENS